MRIGSNVSAAIGALGLVLATTGPSVHAATLYSASPGNAIYTFSYPSANNTTVTGIGDDYDIGAPTMSLTGLSFKGGTNVSTDSVAIKFYNTAGVLVHTILPAPSDVFGNTSTHSLPPGNFGAAEAALPGKGFIVFQPYNSGGTSAAFSLYFGGSPTIGLSDNTIAAQTPPDGSLETGRYVFGFGNVNQVAELQFFGTAIPEPTAFALAAPIALLLKRRRIV